MAEQGPRTPEQQLEWEARHRGRAAVASALGGALLFTGLLARALITGRAPNTSYLESLQHAERPGEVGALPSLQAPVANFLSDHAFVLLLTFFVEALGLFGIAYAMTFLAAATKARRDRFPKVALYLPVVGGVLAGIASIARGIGRLIDVNQFLDGSRTVESAQDIGLGGLSLVAEVLLYPATIALGAGIIMVSLQAMRAGLLTRFLGIMGVFVGGLQVVQVVPLPLVQAYWFVALAVVLGGKRPQSEPPAWRTGREEPWPSGEQIAAARREKRGAQQPKPEPVPAGGVPHAATSKRKRKRRR
jgi:hypothetical protein